MLRAVIIEDSITGREALEGLLMEFCFGKVEVVGTGDCYTSGINIIRKTKPDVVFLDIELPGGTGFDVLDALDEKERNFAVICTTDWIKYAYQAIQDGVIAFLTKPIDYEQLIAAVDKAILDREKETICDRVKNNSLLLDFLEASHSSSAKIILIINKQKELVPLLDILYCESDHKYTIFHKTDGQEVRMRRNLCEYENFLKTKDFHRVNRSEIVNLNHIISSPLDVLTTNIVVLSNTQTLTISRNHQEGLCKNIKLIQNS